MASKADLLLFIPILGFVRLQIASVTESVRSVRILASPML